jgi:hydrogenase maturation protein HypF
MRADDSVMKLAGDRPLFLRRARGYVPYPQEVPEELAGSSHILALGGELKDTVSFYKNGYVVTSQFLGDLDDYRNFRYFEETISHLAGLFGVSPQTVVSDLHPDFRTTAFGGIPVSPSPGPAPLAHVLAALLEHRVPMKKGPGILRRLWLRRRWRSLGGEFLVADYNSWFRMAHFAEVLFREETWQPRQPWRMALSHLRSLRPRPPQDSFLRPGTELSPECHVHHGGRVELAAHLELRPPVSRRFFSRRAGPREVEFEAEAPMRLEAAARDGLRSSYPSRSGNFTFPGFFQAAIREIVADLGRRVPLK